MRTSGYDKKSNSKIPEEIRRLTETANAVTPTKFDRMDELLTDRSLRLEAGYVRMADGNYLVSMYCPMPGVTEEMIDWWFWWHPQASGRYRMWFPGEHFSVGYAKRNREYFRNGTQPEFQPNTQYPLEKIGKLIMPLSIDFEDPLSFGFSREAMEKGGAATIVCGNVGAVRGLVKHTKMAHIFFRDGDGLFMISRFWIGKSLRTPILRNLILKGETAKGMAEHCCVEYRNLARMLPGLYSKNHITE